MDVAMSLLGGGLRVQVLMQGKKVPPSCKWAYPILQNQNPLISCWSPVLYPAPHQQFQTTHCWFSPMLTTNHHCARYIYNLGCYFNCVLCITEETHEHLLNQQVGQQQIVYSSSCISIALIVVWLASSVCSMVVPKSQLGHNQFVSFLLFLFLPLQSLCS